MHGYAAVVLAGGAARRLGGVDKPAQTVGGLPMLHRVLAAVADASPRIVVGPPGPLPDTVLRTREDPPGGGPVAAASAGVALLPSGTPVVALLAADLPFLTSAALLTLRRAATGRGVEGAVYVDHTGRPQWLCGVWRTGPLRARIDALPDGPAGVPLGALLGAAPVTFIPAGTDELAGTGTGGSTRAAGPTPPPWYDCDTEADLRQARTWARIEEGAVALLDDWTTAVCDTLGVDVTSGPVDQRLVLDLARDVAHAVARPAAPLSTYLLGLAVGRGIDPARAAAEITELARRWPPTPPDTAPVLDRGE